MFFEASSIGCRSAKCRKSRLGDMGGIIEFVLNDNNAKIVNSVISYKLKRGEIVKGKGDLTVGCWNSFLEREGPHFL